MLVLLACVAPLTFKDNDDKTRKLLFAAGPQDEVPGALPERMTYGGSSSNLGNGNICGCAWWSGCSALNHPRPWCAPPFGGTAEAASAPTRLTCRHPALAGATRGD